MAEKQNEQEEVSNTSTVNGSAFAAWDSWVHGEGVDIFLNTKNDYSQQVYETLKRMNKDNIPSRLLRSFLSVDFMIYDGTKFQCVYSREVVDFSSLLMDPKLEEVLSGITVEHIGSLPIQTLMRSDFSEYIMGEAIKTSGHLHPEYVTMEPFGRLTVAYALPRRQMMVDDVGVPDDYDGSIPEDAYKLGPVIVINSLHCATSPIH